MPAAGRFAQVPRELEDRARGASAPDGVWFASAERARGPGESGQDQQAGGENQDAHAPGGGFGTAILPMNLKKWSLIIKHLRILRFMGAMRATRFPGSLIMDHIGSPGEGTRPTRGRFCRGVGRVPIVFGMRVA